MQSKTLFLTIFDLRLSIVLTFSIAAPRFGVYYLAWSWTFAGHLGLFSYTR